MKEIKLPREGLRRFFNYAQARHQIYLYKRLRPQWETDDPILYRFRFTNVFRELDKTTKWFADNVRGPLHRNKDERVLLATVVFRMLNRIESGVAMFQDNDLKKGFGAFEEFAARGDVRPLKRALVSRTPRGPYVTGAYIISSPAGMTKLDGVLWVLQNFWRKSDWRHWLNDNPRRNEYSLEGAWEWLREQPYFGNFHSYEIVTDLRHTFLLNKANDIDTWASPGPGCKRGLNRVMGRDKTAKFSGRDEMLKYMVVILDESSRAEHWSRMRVAMGMTKKEWPDWEMRDVEHTLCEFDKYERVRLKEGKPRGVYRA